VPVTRTDRNLLTYNLKYADVALVIEKNKYKTQDYYISFCIGHITVNQDVAVLALVITIYNQIK